MFDVMHGTANGAKNRATVDGILVYEFTA